MKLKFELDLEDLLTEDFDYFEDKNELRLKDDSELKDTIKQNIADTVVKCIEERLENARNDYEQAWSGTTIYDILQGQIEAYQDCLNLIPAPRTEQEILNEFEKLGYEVVCNSDRELILEQELKSNYTIINRIHIEKQLQSYSKTQFAYRVGSSPLWVSIQEHKLLNELFTLWGWL